MFSAEVLIGPVSMIVSGGGMHTGQIILLAKIEAADKWTTLSIPRGQSTQYNANPTLEKRPAR